MIPRGFSADLVKFCQKEGIPFRVVDKRKKLEPIVFDSDIDIQHQQELALHATREKDFGVIVSPPGSGKTIIGLEIIAEKRQPALIIVHRQQLYDQWIDRIQSFLKIPKKEIGQIGKQKFKIGKQVTVAMIQSLSRNTNLDNIKDSFGTIIIVEKVIITLSSILVNQFFLTFHLPFQPFLETILYH